jgi:hypothetical protein
MPFFWNKKPEITPQSAPCAQCGRTDYKFPIHGNHAYEATRGKVYCSEPCYAEGKVVDPHGYVLLGVVDKPFPVAPAVPKEQAALLVGTKYENGRCTACGRHDSRCPEYRLFCSDACREKAARPHVPDDYYDSVSDDPDYVQIVKALEEDSGHTDRQFNQIAKQLGYRGTRAEFRADVCEKQRIIKRQFTQRRLDDEHRAVEIHLKDWLSERAAILGRELDKWYERHTREQERTAKELDKQREREVAELAKRTQDQERIEERDYKEWQRNEERAVAEWEKEQERLRKEQEAEQARQAEEERWKPRHFKR